MTSPNWYIVMAEPQCKLWDVDLGHDESGGLIVSHSGLRTRRVTPSGDVCGGSAWRQARSIRWAELPVRYSIIGGKIERTDSVAIMGTGGTKKASVHDNPLRGASIPRVVEDALYYQAAVLPANQHCAECRGCALRSRYYRQSKYPVQEYPESTYSTIFNALPNTADRVVMCTYPKCGKAGHTHADS